MGGGEDGGGGSGLGDGVDSGAGRYSGEGSSVCPSLAYCYMAVDSDSARIRLTDSDTVDSDTTAGLDTVTAAGSDTAAGSLLSRIRRRTWNWRLTRNSSWLLSRILLQTRIRRTLIRWLNFNMTWWLTRIP